MQRTAGSATRRLLADPRYEIVPLPRVWEQARHLPAGATVAVTSSPSRGPEPTIQLAEELATAGYDAVPHIAARGLRSEMHLEDAVGRMDAAGVRDVFVVGGDNPEPAGPYADGVELLTALRELGHPFVELGVPSYPEGHPLIGDEALWGALRRKQREATYTVTQMCFDAGAVAGWGAELGRRGISLPVRFGIPGVVEPRKLLRMSARIGIGESSRFLRKHARLGWRLLRPGDYRPDRLVRELATSGPVGADVRGVHLYTFNQVGATVAWVRDRSRPAGAA